MTKFTNTLTRAAMFTALIAVFTFFPHIPLSTGYIHLGDSLIYAGAILYGGIFGGVTAGIGSAIADMLVAPVYAIPTLIIKGLMGYTAGRMSRNDNLVSGRNFAAMLVSGLIMLVGYAAVDGIMTNNFATALYSAAANAIQYVGGIALGTALVFAIDKTGILK